MAPPSPTSAVTPEGRDPLVGAEFAGRYQILRRIGAGGMGTVYEALHHSSGRRCAIKVVLPALLEDQVYLERFKREAAITSSLRNPHIAEVIEFDHPEGTAPFLAMEYLDGEDLSRRLRKQRSLSVSAVRILVDGVASALDAAHTQGILHRDIKPANVFIAHTGDGGEAIKLLDFGAAKDQGSSSQLTSTGQVIGSVWYVSPEQARGQDLDARTDLFSLGIVAFEALAGRRPFEGESPTDTLFKIVSDPAPVLSSFNPALPEALDAVLARALSKRREDRYPGVLEFADAFASAVDPTHVPRFSARPRTQPGLVRSDATLNKFPAFQDEVPAAPVDPVVAARQDRDAALVRELQNANLLTLDGLRQGLELVTEVEAGFTIDRLIELGLLDERAFLRHLGASTNLRYVGKDKVAAYRVPSDVLEKLSASKAEELMALPLAFDAAGRALTVVVCDARPDLAAQVRTAAINVNSVQLILALRSTVRAGIRKHYFSDLDAFRSPVGRFKPPAPPSPTPTAGGLPKVTPARGSAAPKGSTPHPGPAPRPPSVLTGDDAISEPLVQAGLLRPEDLARARTTALAEKSALADVLLRLGLVREIDFLRVLGGLYQTQTLTADKVAQLIAPSPLLDRLRQAEADELCCFPFSQGARGDLHVVAGAPLHPDLRARIKTATGASAVGVYLAAPGAVRAALKKWYLPEGAVLEGALVLDEAAAAENNKTLIMGKVVDLPPPPAEELRGIAQAPLLDKEIQGLLPLEPTRAAMALRIVSALLQRFAADRAALVLDKGEVWQRGAEGPSTDEVPREVVEQALSENQVVAIHDVASDPRLASIPSLAARSIHAVLCAPLQVSKLRGVLYLESRTPLADDAAARLAEFADWSALRLVDVQVPEAIRRESETRQHLSRYLPPSLVDYAVESGAELAPDGESANVTLIAAEIRGLVALVARQDPRSTIAAVQRLIGEIVEVVHAHGGGIHQLTGEGLVAIWGAAQSTGGPREALGAAVEIQQRLSQPQVCAPGISFALAVHAGPVTVGCVGAEGRKAYVTVGGAMQAVHRLCSLTLDGQLFATEPVVSRAGAVAGRKPIPVARLEGIGTPVLAYVLAPAAG